MDAGKVAVVGAGLIGRGWVAAFGRAGREVAVWSRARATSDAALAYVREITPQLAREGLLNGRDPDAVLAAISIADTLEEAVDGADYIQESLPEDLGLKREIIAALDGAAAPEAIIASSASALLPSEFTGHVAGRGRCLVAHPLNPPHLIPATEIVPAPWTDEQVVERTCEIVRAAGKAPVVLRKEIDGFVVNRLQAAILEEAFRLVAGGYATIADVDTAVRDGLSLRWSFMGPFETIDLNAPKGVRDYVERYTPLYRTLLAQMRDPVDWGEALDVVERDRRDLLPLDRLQDRQMWRDRRLIALATHKQAAAERLGA